MKTISLLSLLLALLSGPAHAIKKCKDADGNWHYGDIAVEQCKESKITTLNNRGFIEKEDEPPLTDAQLDQEEKSRIAAQKILDERNAIESERRRVINIYESEDDIDRQRDNQLNSVQTSIAVHQDYLKSMDTRIAHYDRQLAKARIQKSIDKINGERDDALKGIENSKQEIKLLEKQKKSIIAKFDREKEIYREIMAEKQ